MQDLSVKHISSSILKRAHKVRLRMMVEKLSGVPAENKQVFLSNCLLYERRLMNEYAIEESNISRSEASTCTESNWAEASGLEESNLNAPLNWADWYKIDPDGYSSSMDPLEGRARRRAMPFSLERAH